MLEKYEQAMDSWIEAIVDSGDDDALFASGYLQGHVAVVLSQLEAQQQQSIEILDIKMADCLLLARQELEDGDYQLVENAWDELRQLLLRIA